MNELNKKIEEWIKKGGFPFEMRVAKAFINAGFDVAQSVYYYDKEIEKFRETDIVASQPKLINGVWVNLVFVIECKVTTDKPWVSLINKGIKYYTDELPIYITKNGHKFIHKIRMSEGFKSDFLYRNSRRIGYSIITAFNKEGKEPSFDAIQSITKACEHFLKECNEKRMKQLNLYFPSIAIDGLIFNSMLSETGEIRIEQVNSAEVSITRSFHTYGNANVLVFDSSNLEKTATELFERGLEFYDKYDQLLHENINSA